MTAARERRMPPPPYHPDTVRRAGPSRRNSSELAYGNQLLALGIEQRHRTDKFLLAICFRPGFLRLVNVLLPLFDLFRVGLIPELVPDDDRLAPTRHRAALILQRDVVKSLLRLLVLE